jgi:hypothetical protein
MKCTPQIVEDFFLDSQKQLDLFEDFIEKGGKRTLILYVQLGEQPTIESGRIATVSNFWLSSKMLNLTGDFISYYIYH